MSSATAPYYSTTQTSMLNQDNMGEGQSYEDHSEVYSHIARSLAPDAAMHAYARKSLPSEGNIDSIHGIDSRQLSTSGTARPREPLSAEKRGDDRGINTLKHHGRNNGRVSAIGSHTRPASNDQFAGLLQAVTTAAGEEAAQDHAAKGVTTSNLSNRPKRFTRQSRVNDDQVSSGNISTTTGKRKRTSNVAQARTKSIEHPLAVENGARKRLRIAEPSLGSDSEEIDATRSAEIAQAVDESYTSLEIRELPPQLAMSDARAAGVHSAAALFRRPSASSKKYTRPPMSKLFTSLELSPENFLHLQAAAKSYMLNKAYPERQDCVGNRGKGDTDMVKLRLYNCVKEFLEAEGYGDKYFGKDVVNEGIGDRRFSWPSHKNKVIALVTPLLRRMVTNERQRQYAIETRKGPGGRSGASKKRKADEMESPSRDRDFQLRYDSGDIDIDPNLELESPFVGVPTNGHLEDSGTSQRLAELLTFSRLPRQDWDAIVMRVFDHVRKQHQEDQIEKHCEDGCHENFLNEEAKNGILNQSDWGLSDGATDNEKHSYALLVMRDLFGVINSTVNEERRAQGLQTSTTIPLNGEHEEISESEDVCETRASKRQTASETVMPATDETLKEPTLDTGDEPLKLHIFYMDHGERMGPPLALDVARCPNYLTLARTINKNIPEQDPKRFFDIQAHLFDGLHKLDFTEDFDEAIESAKRTKWMENELKIIVNMRENWKDLGDSID